MPPRPFSTPALRHELRMKPFLPLGTPVLPTHSQLTTLTTYPPTTTLASIFTAIDSSLKTCKQELALLKTVKPEVGKFVGCEKAWADEVKGALGSAIGAGLAVAGLKGLVAKVGARSVGDLEGKREEVKGGWVVEVPVVEKRWRGGWCVPKISEVKK